MWITTLYFAEYNVEKTKICADCIKRAILEKKGKLRREMRNIKLTVCYEGTRYSGWQKQKNTENTIQGKMERLIGQIVGEVVEVHGSGRTDAGVHAFCQVANVKVRSEIEPDELMARLNAVLPEDIAVTGMEEADERFHARLSAVRKTYQYRIYVGNAKPVFDRRFMAVLETSSLEGKEKLDIGAMRAAAGYLLGVHDFTSFCGNPSFKKSAVRRIDSLEVMENEAGDELTLRITGDGFLQNMVRITVGTLLEVGKGVMKPEEIRRILAAKDRKMAGPMAPAKGLTLVGVEY